MIPPRKHAEQIVANLDVERDMRELRAILYDMETTQRRELDVRDISDAESEEIEVE
jgi:hypothetical protein